MLLFLDRLPLFLTTLQDGAQVWTISLPALPTERRQQSQGSTAQYQRWQIDTAFSGAAFCWASQLHMAGLSLTKEWSKRKTTFRVADGTVYHNVPIRRANLWLFSNIPALLGKPFKLELADGITVFDPKMQSVDGKPAFPLDLSKPPQSATPLLGLRAIQRAGLCVTIHGTSEKERRDNKFTFSLWVPRRSYHCLTLGAERLFKKYRGQPVHWENPRRL